MTVVAVGLSQAQHSVVPYSGNDTLTRKRFLNPENTDILHRKLLPTGSNRILRLLKITQNAIFRAARPRVLLKFHW